MSAKRRRGRIDQVENRTGENKTFSNKPFKGLTNLKGPERSTEALPPEDTAKETEEDLFQIAMKGVIPLRDKGDRIVRAPVKKEKSADQLPVHSKNIREYLSCLVRESAAWDISFSDEYMEGAVSGVGPKVMKRLKRGEFSIQDYVDLHGLTKKEAEAAVNEFIVLSYQKGLRCVLIVHGRGLGSVDHQPAIKKELPVWLRRGVLKKIVLAFVTARPCDGGAGASYVLLKKR